MSAPIAEPVRNAMPNHYLDCEGCGKEGETQSAYAGALGIRLAPITWRVFTLRPPGSTEPRRVYVCGRDCADMVRALL